MAPPSRKKKIRNAQQAAALLQHVAQLSKQSSIVADSATPAQQRFIEDPSRLKAALCTRRAGKSYGAGLYLVQESLAHPGCTCLFIGLTRESAKRIFVRNILQDIAKKHGISGTWNGSDLSFTFSNGSVVYLVGADASAEQREKLLGQKYRLVVIDECASFRQDLEDLVYATLLPAVADDDGSICLIGTPGNTKGFFFKVTTGEKKGWSLHSWSWKDNPYTKDQIERVVLTLTTNDPLIVETPRFRQSYNGEWTVDDSKLVYSYSEDRNRALSLPSLRPGDEWTYVLGIDLGWTAESAWVVVAYSRHDPVLYVVDTFKRQQLITDKIAQKTQEFLDFYQPMLAVVVDAGGLGRNIAEDMNARHSIAYEAAKKHGKYERQQMLNSDLITGKIKLLPQCEDLAEEWAELVWDERELDKGKHVEHSSCPDHLSDAFLYAWGRARNYAVTPIRPDSPAEGTDEWMAKFWERQGQKAAASAAQPWWERDAGIAALSSDEDDPFGRS